NRSHCGSCLGEPAQVEERAAQAHPREVLLVRGARGLCHRDRGLERLDRRLEDLRRRLRLAVLQHVPGRDPAEGNARAEVLPEDDLREPLEALYLRVALRIRTELLEEVRGEGGVGARAVEPEIRLSDRPILL